MAHNEQRSRLNSLSSVSVRCKEASILLQRCGPATLKLRSSNPVLSSSNYASVHLGRMKTTAKCVG